MSPERPPITARRKSQVLPEVVREVSILGNLRPRCSQPCGKGTGGLLERAQHSGATIREPLTTFVSGERYASLRDPFGIRWSIMTRVEDLSEEESNRRVAEWAAQQG